MKPELNQEFKERQIYLARHPLTDSVVYVGVTSKSLKERLRHHKNCRLGRFPEFVKDLLLVGLSPKMEIVETISENSDWQERERYWIAHFRERGVNLLNETIGGLGGAGRRCTEEQKVESSARMKKVVYSLNVYSGIVEEWDSVNSLADYLKINATAVSNAIRKQGLTGKHLVSHSREGFVFKPSSMNYQRPITCLFPDGSKSYFKSAYSAGKILNMDCAAIIAVAAGKYKQYKKLIFTYSVKELIEAGFVKLKEQTL